AETAALVADFAACVAPSATHERVERGKAAAARLLDLARALVADGPRGPLLAAGVDAANAVGFMSQSYEATAGLVGNTLVARARPRRARAPPRGGGARRGRPARARGGGRRDAALRRARAEHAPVRRARRRGRRPRGRGRRHDPRRARGGEPRSESEPAARRVR